MTKKLIFLFSILRICIFPTLSQTNYAHLESNFTETRPMSVPSELIMTDYNNDTIAVVVVESPLDGLIFRGNVFGDVKQTTENGIHKYYVNLTNGTRKLTVKHDSYHEVGIIFPQPIGSKELWKCRVVGVDTPNPGLVDISETDFTHPVIINVEPWATLLIDEDVSEGGNLRLEEGSHYITSKYKNNVHNQKINVNKPNMNVDATIGGTLTIKSASGVPSIRSLDNSPMALLIRQTGSTYVFGNMLGKYDIVGESNGIGFLGSKSVSKYDVNVNSRSNTTLRFDEMRRYSFVLYQGTPKQPIGFNLGVCKKIGWFASYLFNLKSSIDTRYGETQFIEKDSNGDEVVSLRSTSMTILTGPMIRVFRKFYAQIGGGAAIYLRTSEPHLLTADYKNVVGGSVCATFFYRINWLIFGAGYIHQFVKDAYDPSISNQITFSAGIAL